VFPEKGGTQPCYREKEGGNSTKQLWAGLKEISQEKTAQSSPKGKGGTPERLPHKVMGLRLAGGKEKSQIEASESNMGRRRNIRSPCTASEG